MLPVLLYMLDLLVAELTADFGGRAHHQRARRDMGARCNQRTCSDEALFTDHRFIENNRADADQRAVLDGTTMEDDAVADGDTIADARGKLPAGDVNDAVVLNVAAMADLYGIDIAAQDTVKPHARMLADLYIPDNLCAFFDKCSF